jgi:hypothetical protein
VTRRVTAALGALLALLGLVALAAPGLLTGLPANQGIVSLLGVVLLLGALREVQRRRSNDRAYAETPDTEETIDLPTPGDDFDRRFDALGMTRYRVGERERIREEVSDVAAETVVRRRGLSPEDARRRLDEGTWTDDPYAAALFTGRPPAVGRLPKAREILRSEPAFKTRTRRAVDELAGLAEGDEEAEE